MKWSIPDRSRVLVLVLIMAVGLVIVTGTTIWLLYDAALDSLRARLIETAESQARLIEAIAREEATHAEEYGDRFEEVVLDQLVEAHQLYESSKRTGEFVLAQRQGDLIVFVLEHRHLGVRRPDPVPFDADLAEPMRRALSGESGTMVGLDYQGTPVLAAYEPVGVLDLGIVVKIDLDAVQAPFWRAGLFAMGVSLVVLIAGAILTVRVSNPLVTELQERTLMLEGSLAALTQNEERARQIFELAGVGIARLSLEGFFLDVNPKVCAITGYSRAELRTMSFQDITHPDDLDADLDVARRLSEGEIDHYSMEKRYERKDGSVVWVNLTGSVVRDDNMVPIHFIAVVEDISRRKDVESALKKSLDEKEALLQEVHHRVKNNMQVISSLLSLQAESIDDPRLKQLHQESQGRVRAMALIHEILYDSGDLSRIELKPYIEKLASSLMRIFGAGKAGVRLTVDANDAAIGIDAMVPCGLAVSELISNSMKHAFPDGRDGSIEIYAVAKIDGEIEIVICDDGVGMPPDLDIRNTGSVGMGLVVSLVEKQLGGRLNVDRSEGTCFKISIPPKISRSSVVTET